MGMEQSRYLYPAVGVGGDQSGFWASLEAAAAVRLIATFDALVTCYEDELLVDAISRAEAGNYDHLPVLRRGENVIVGILNRLDAPTVDLNRLVASVMEPLGPLNLISADAPLLRYVEIADASRCRMVLNETKVCGIVTLSDLQKLPVRCVLFTLVTHFELLLTEQLKRQYPDNDSLFDLIRIEGQRTSALRTWRRMRGGNTSIARHYALSLRDKMQIWASSNGNAAVQEEVEPVYQLRNGLAHASDYAATETDARNTAALVGKLRQWVGLLAGTKERIGVRERIIC